MVPLNLLALAAFVDELQGGVPVVGAPELGEGLGVGEFGVFAVVLAVPTAVSLLVEPAILAWSDRADRRRVLVFAYLAMALLPLAAVAAPTAAGVALAIGLWGAATGVASGIAQGAIAQHPDGASVGLARWLRGAVLGDLAAPVLLAAAAAAGFGWRGAMAAAALVPLVAALATARIRLPPLVDEDEEDVPLREAVATALRDAALLAWSVAAAGCTLLDETLVVLVALREHAAGAVGAAAVAVLLAASAVGGFAAEPLVRRFPPRSLLVGMSVGSVVGLVGFVLTPAGSASGVAALALLGAAAAPLYPLVQAEALARLPTRPGLVHALQTPLAWIDVAAPLGLGALAAGVSVDAAVGALLLQPVVVVLAVVWTRRRPQRSSLGSPAANASR